MVWCDVVWCRGGESVDRSIGIELFDHTPTGNQYAEAGTPRPLLPGEISIKKQNAEKEKKEDPWTLKKTGAYGFSSYSTAGGSGSGSGSGFGSGGGVSTGGAAGTTAAASGSGPVASTGPITVLTATQLAAQQNSGPATVRMPVVSVLRINNNELSGWNDFMPCLNQLLFEPVHNLNWLDLSHNRLSSVDPAIATLTNLQVLYLHGNAITDISQLNKLSACKQLTKLAVHGNQYISTHPESKKKSVARLEDTAFYRSRLIYTLQDTNLKMLDFSAITPRDRQYALVWFQNHSKRKAKPGASLSPNKANTVTPPTPPSTKSPSAKAKK